MMEEQNDFENSAPERGRRRPWLRRVLLLAGPLAVLCGAAVLYFGGGRYVSTENAYVKATSVMVTAEVTGSIAEVFVKENQHVERGDLLFRIDQRPYRIALQEAEANLKSVRDEILKLKASYAKSAEELSLAQADLDFAKREFARQQNLLEKKVISHSAFDAAKHEFDVAKRQVLVIDQELAETRADLAGDPEIEVAKHPRYLAAEAARDRAALDLERTEVRSPLSGVASNAPDPGQQVIGSNLLSSPVMNVVASEGLWVEANFKETELTNLRKGQPVEITVDAFPGKEWRGWVDSVSPATGAEFSVIPAQNATGNWVKVVQRVPVRIAVGEIVVDESGGGAVLRAGMSSIVEVDTGQRRRLPGFLRNALDWVDGSSALAQDKAVAEQ